MFQNRIRRFARLWEGQESLSQAEVPAGFVVIPIQNLPPAVQQRLGCCGELYRLAFEQARAAAEAANVDFDEFNR